MIFSGVNPESGLVEMAELGDHPWFLTCQFHPEFRSKPFAPHPMFVGFVRASLQESTGRHRDLPSRVSRTPLQVKNGGRGSKLSSSSRRGKSGVTHAGR